MGRRRIVKHSKGELLCGSILRQLGVSHLEPQYPLDGFYFDYAFSYNNIPFLLEYDGIQHFQYVKYIHGRESNFHRRFQKDVDKTGVALIHGFTLIRLAYPLVMPEDIRDHIKQGLLNRNRLYLSHPDLYEPMLQRKISPSTKLTTFLTSPAAVDADARILVLRLEGLPTERIL